MIHRRRLIKLSAAAALAPSVACPAIAQETWPNKPVRIIIPFTPGGGLIVGPPGTINAVVVVVVIGFLAAIQFYFLTRNRYKV